MTIAGAINFVGNMPDIDRSLHAMALGKGKSRLHRDAGQVLGICDDAEMAVDGPVVALFHGRLDHAAELDLPRVGRSAAQVLLDAYRRWDLDFPLRLVGDFAGAIWDGRARRLLLIRDALGMIPLYFWRNGAEVLFATEPQGLLAQPRVERTIDERWIARWLALLPHSDAGTLHRGMERVLPGHLALFDDEGPRQLRYWRPEELSPIRLARDEDYAEAIRMRLDEAIRCRIAGAEVVGSHLSAGLDSSSVTACTARQLNERGLRLTAYTAVPVAGFDGSAYRDRIWDEGPLAARVAEAYPNIDHVLVPNDGSALFDVLDRVGETSSMPVVNTTNQVWSDAIGQAAKRRGVTVMLSGGKGNMTISYDGFGFLTRLAHDGRWVTLARHLLAHHRTGTSWASLGNRVIAPLLPAPLRRFLRRLFGRPELELHAYSALRADFAERAGILDEAKSMAGNVGNTALGRRDVRLAVLGRADSAMVWRSQKRRFGFTLCDPTFDRRLVELCLAIPAEQFLLHGESRSLVRRAMHGILPDAVRLERRKGLQAADWSRQMTAARSEIIAEVERLERSPLASACLDLPRLRHLVENWPDGGWHSAKTMQSYQLALARGLATGRFLRRFEGGNE
ncbi:asparagine synthase-related protein [Bradyrhizobium sp. OK095]|uniref:asparagine synthetase B family protein n=1 Tax=Bradyrhizobium sp. OK095 TaxID=1882760 RepID=UPI0015A555E6|nr:asparagine synthase-related protein [Bradyrhizobium sp. OK095]